MMFDQAHYLRSGLRNVGPRPINRCNPERKHFSHILRGNHPAKNNQNVLRLLFLQFLY